MAALDSCSLPEAQSKLVGQPFMLESRLSFVFAAPLPRGWPPAPLAIQGNSIVRQDTRQQEKIRGINWFGFNVGRTSVDGLGVGGSDVSGDFSTIVYQLK